MSALQANDRAKVILVVDDEEIVRNIVVKVVKRIPGVETLCASSCREALEILKSRDVDMVISDMNMPGEQGVQIAQELKKEGKSTPVIIHSGSIIKGGEAKIISMGAVAVIKKPANVESLTNVVLKFLGI